MPDVDRQSERRNVPNKKFVALLYLPLTIPGIIPLYYATQQEESAVAAVMVATGVGMLILNAIILIVAYRWFTRPRTEDEGRR